LDFLASQHRLILYDKQGTGLSDRELNIADGFERHADEVVELLDHLGVERAVMVGASQAAPVTIDLAARYPERTERIVVTSGYANGPRIFFRPEVLEAMTSLIRTHWGMGAKVLTDMLFPDADAEAARRQAHIQRASAEPETAALLLQEIHHTDVSDRLADVKCPALIFHRRGDRAIPFRGGQEIAAGIDGARFFPVEGTAHAISNEDDLDDLLPVFAEFIGGGDVSSETTTLKVILFTDLAGSTAMQARLGDEAAREVLRAHDAAVRRGIEKSSGREIKHAGDGVMAAFGSAADAVNCALTVRRDIETYNDNHDGEELLVRFGLNAGEPIAEDDDLFGLSVTLAARIGDWGEPGRVLVSDVVRQLLLGKGFEFAPAGSAELKGFDAPVALYEVRAG
jgi:class 3 adenylate cyclase